MAHHPSKEDAAAVHPVDRRRARRVIRLADFGRGICGLLQYTWLLGLLGLAILTVAGTIAGVALRLQHGPGTGVAMPVAWTPLVAVFVGTTLTGFVIAGVAILGRIACAAALAGAARSNAGLEALGEMASRPPARGLSLGACRLTSVDPPSGSHRLPGWLRFALRIGGLVFGLAGIVAGMMTFILSGAGASAGVQPIMAVVFGVGIAALAVRPMHGTWSVEGDRLVGYGLGWGLRRRCTRVHLAGAHLESPRGWLGPAAVRRWLVVEGRTAGSPMEVAEAADASPSSGHRAGVRLGRVCPGCTGAVTVQRLRSLPGLSQISDRPGG
ncbi:MAG: hypothetical protein AB8G96_15520 [Phycisphaerales bacterium]